MQRKYSLKQPNKNQTQVVDIGRRIISYHNITLCTITSGNKAKGRKKKTDLTGKSTGNLGAHILLNILTNNKTSSVHPKRKKLFIKSNAI